MRDRGSPTKLTKSTPSPAPFDVATAMAKLDALLRHAAATEDRLGALERSVQTGASGVSQLEGRFEGTMAAAMAKLAEAVDNMASREQAFKAEVLQESLAAAVAAAHRATADAREQMTVKLQQQLDAMTAVTAHQTQLMARMEFEMKEGQLGSMSRAEESERREKRNSVRAAHPLAGADALLSLQPHAFGTRDAVAKAFDVPIDLVGKVQYIGKNDTHVFVEIVVGGTEWVPVEERLVVAMQKGGWKTSAAFTYLQRQMDLVVNAVLGKVREVGAWQEGQYAVKGGELFLKGHNGVVLRYPITHHLRSSSCLSPEAVGMAAKEGRLIGLDEVAGILEKHMEKTDPPPP